MRWGACGSALQPHSFWEGDRRGCTKVRTGIGKSDLPGSQGGLWKRGDDGSRTEAQRETAGRATVPYAHARATFLSRRSGQQGRESWRVRVPSPSIARFGRLAYPLLGEVTDRDMRGRKSHGCPVVGDRRLDRGHGSRISGQCESAGSPTEPYRRDAGAGLVGYAAVGTIWVASKPGGLNMSEWLQPRNEPPY